MDVKPSPSILFQRFTCRLPSVGGGRYEAKVDTVSNVLRTNFLVVSVKYNTLVLDLWVGDTERGNLGIINWGGWNMLGNFLKF